MTSRDPNEAAAEAVRKATEHDGEPLPPDMEAAWEAWIAGVQKVDERARTLLRAAFEAGVEAGSGVSTAAELGRKGGLKGGKARAAKLTPERRREIAKKAAAKRWGNDQAD